MNIIFTICERERHWVMQWASGAPNPHTVDTRDGIGTRRDEHFATKRFAGIGLRGERKRGRKGFLEMHEHVVAFEARVVAFEAGFERNEEREVGKCQHSAAEHRRGSEH